MCIPLRVLAARAAIARKPDDILIVYGDTPLIRPASLSRLRRALADGAAVGVLGFRAAAPSGYGRLITNVALYSSCGKKVLETTSGKTDLSILR